MLYPRDLSGNNAVVLWPLWISLRTIHTIHSCTVLAYSLGFLFITRYVCLMI